MPQPFNNAVITNSGARLLTRAQAGEIKIQFTRMAVGSGIYSEEEKDLLALQERTGLKSEQNSYLLSDIAVHSDHSVKITALITNADPVSGAVLVNNGYYINEMGLFAKEKDAGDSTEVLYSIAVVSGECGDFMPPYNGYYPVQIIQDYFATVNNSAQVTVRNSGAVLLREEFNRFRKEVSEVLGTFIQAEYDAETETLHLSRKSFSGGFWNPSGSGDGYGLPVAGRDALGCVKAGDGINIAEDGTISVDTEASAEAAAEVIETDLDRVTAADVRNLFGK